MKIKIGTRKLLFVALALAAIAIMLRAPATAAAQGATADDPPDRVADLSFLQGSVSFQPAGGGDNDWVAAETNRPLTTGDQLWADSDGMVEMLVGSTAVRMDHNTGISFLTLSDNLVQLQVSAGSVVVRLRQLDPNDAFEIDAPNLAFTLVQPGTYQVSVDPDKDVTVVTVVNGEGQVTGGGRAAIRVTGNDRLRGFGHLRLVDSGGRLRCSLVSRRRRRRLGAISRRSLGLDCAVGLDVG